METPNEMLEKQRMVCQKHSVHIDVPKPGSKLGISLKSKKAGLPLNGLRHSPEKGTNGWYIWWGDELGSANDFFDSMHVEHLGEECPEVMEYLALPPGWRFLIQGDYADVWYDSNLISTTPSG